MWSRVLLRCTVRAVLAPADGAAQTDRGTERLNIADWLTGTLDPKSRTLPARLFKLVYGLMVIVGISAAVFGTVPKLAAPDGNVVAIAFYLALAFFTAEYFARLIGVPRFGGAGPHAHAGAARLDWARSIGGIVDLVTVLPILIALAAGLDPATARLFGMLWVLKLGRYSPRLGLLGRVLRQARESLIGVFFAFLIVLFAAATLGYLFERHQQPQQFGSIPAALWWAITTLTTTGYGDAVPVTPLGRLLGGAVMVCGIMLFALWAGILATEFAQEMRRHEFLRTWDLVAKVPFFHSLGAESIAEVARLLKPREVPPGTVIVRRGEPGDRMYFIVSGEVEIKVKPTPVRLGDGSFFGEIALITGEPRTATVVAVRPSVLLGLDIADFRDLAARRPELTRVIDQEAARRVGTANRSRVHD